MTSPEGTLFLEIAQEMGFLSSEQIADLRNAREVMARDLGIEDSLQNIAIKKAVLTKEQVRAVLQEMQNRGVHKELGGFELIEKIGQGGMGAVFRARQKSLNRIVALKILPQKLAKDGEFVQRFINEARAVARLNHPNIVRGLDVGEAGGYYYFAMEYIEGENAKNLIKDGPMNEADAMRIAMDIVRALEHAHRNNLVHRDIKPDNILLDKQGTAKLVDLGLAKTVGSGANLTQAGVIFGTPYYVSPEQAKGSQNTDIRSDIYSLGATLYHLVTGQTPFNGDTPQSIVLKHISEEPAPVGKLAPSLSPGACIVIEKMMEKNIDARYQTPAEIMDDLKLILAGGLPERKVLQAQMIDEPEAVIYQESTSKPRKSRPERAERQSHERPRFIVEDASEKSSKTGLILASAGLVLIVVAAVVFMMVRGKNEDSQYTKVTPNDLVFDDNVQQKPKPAVENKKNPLPAKKETPETPDSPVKKTPVVKPDKKKTEELAAKDWASSEKDVNEKMGRQLYNDAEMLCNLFLEKYAGTALEKKAIEKKKEIAYKAGERFQPIRDEAGRLVRENKFADALRVLERASGIHYLPIQSERDEMREYIEMAQAERKALVRNMSEEAFFKLSADLDTYIKKRDFRGLLKTINEFERTHGTGDYKSGLDDAKDIASKLNSFWDVLEKHIALLARNREKIYIGIAPATVTDYKDGVLHYEEGGKAQTMKLADLSGHKIYIITKNVIKTRFYELPVRIGFALFLAHEGDAVTVKRMFRKLTLEGRDVLKYERIAAELGGDKNERLAKTLFERLQNETIKKNPDPETLRYLSAKLKDTYGRTSIVRENKSKIDRLVAVIPVNARPGTGTGTGQRARPEKKYIFGLKSLVKIEGHKNTVKALAFTPDGSRLVSGSWDRTLRVWNLALKKEERVFSGHKDYVLSVCISPDGRLAASGSRDGEVKVWEIDTGRERLAITAYRGAAWSLCFTPDGRYLVCGRGDGSVRVWNAADGKEKMSLDGHRDAVMAVAVSADGHYVVSGGDDGTVRLWDLAKEKEVRRFEGHNGIVYSVGFDKEYIIGGGKDSVTIWDAQTAKIYKTLDGHIASVLSVAFSPWGRYILSGGADGTMRLWKTRGGMEMQRFSVHDSAVHCVKFSPDGKYAASGGDDYNIQLWQVQR